MATPSSRNYDDIELSEEPGFEFTLGGQEWHCKASDDISWALIENFMLAQADGSTQAIVTQMDDLFRGVLYPDEVDAFITMKHDPSGAVTYTRMVALIQDIVKEVFGVPTQPPASSRSGRRKSARSSEGGSSPTATQSRRAG